MTPPISDEQKALFEAIRSPETIGLLSGTFKGKPAAYIVGAHEESDGVTAIRPLAIIIDEAFLSNFAAMMGGVEGEPLEDVPVYRHYDDRSLFLGRHTGYDLYYRVPVAFDTELIARYGDEQYDLMALSPEAIPTTSDHDPIIDAMIEAMERFKKMKRLGLVPAYGRDYKSKKEIIMALQGDADFQVSDMDGSGKYIDLKQIKESGYTHLNVRYAKNAKVAVLEVAKL